MLHVSRSSRYGRAILPGFRSAAYLFDRSACLIPGTMDVVAPRKLGSAGCAAVLYTLEVFVRLASQEGGASGSESPLRLSFLCALEERNEARKLVLSYLGMEEMSFARSMEGSGVHFEVRDSSILSELRAIVS